MSNVLANAVLFTLLVALIAWVAYTTPPAGPDPVAENPLPRRRPKTPTAPAEDDGPDFQRLLAEVLEITHG